MVVYIIISLNFLVIVLTLIWRYKNITKKNIYPNYLLAFPKNYLFGMENIVNIDDNEKLVIYMKQFCYEYNIFTNGVIISLSGGVDSMVILAILLHLQQTKYFPIYTASIDYQLREESNDEMKFLNRYCGNYDIKSYISIVDSLGSRNGSGKRSEFEDKSRHIRFKLYKDIIIENNVSGIFVGHHQDDIIENVITNLIKGRNIYDLEVMKHCSNVRGVKMFRPFLRFHKSEIYDFAHKYYIPYFLDTTPKWSKRGQMRNEIFPLFDRVFGRSWKNKIKDIGIQSTELDNLMTEQINHYLEHVDICQYGFIINNLPTISSITNSKTEVFLEKIPRILWTKIWSMLFNQNKHRMLKRRTLDKIYQLYISMYDNEMLQVLDLDSGWKCYLNNTNGENHMVIYKHKVLQKLITKSNVESDHPQFENNLKNFLDGKMYYFLDSDIEITCNQKSFRKRHLEKAKLDLPICLVRSFNLRLDSKFKNKYLVCQK